MNQDRQSYPEFQNRWDDGLNAEALIATFWHRDGPHSADSVVSAALAMDELAHYLARATFSSKVLPQGGDMYRLISELRSALGRLDQVFAQMSTRAEQIAHDETLYDDRRDGRDPADTAFEVQGGLDGARPPLGQLLAALGQAHNASGHLGHNLRDGEQLT